jgi:linoleoyl-CoA desaturase
LSNTPRLPSLRMMSLHGTLPDLGAVEPAAKQPSASRSRVNGIAEMPRYRNRDSPFYAELRHRVDLYMKEHGLRRHAGAKMVAKTVAIFGFFFASYLLILTNHFAGMSLFVALVLMHLSLFLTTIGVAHDATHYCYFKSRRANEIMWLIFDLLGVNSTFWVNTHVHSHHHAPNVALYDSAIESFALVRFHPKTRYHPLARYQHLYMFVVYGFATLFQCYLLEFVSITKNFIGFRDGDRKSRLNITRVYLFKVLMMGYSFVLPLVLVKAPAWQIVLGCLAGHFACGIMIGVVFMTTHLAQDTTFPEADANGLLADPHAEHILATTADFSVGNPVVTWLAGGLNLHVAHHLFPSISQVHLPQITKIVAELARRYGLRYRSYTLLEALLNHLRLLKRLGSLPTHPAAR